MTTSVLIKGESYLTADYNLPAKRNFRDAWSTPVGRVVSVDMQKAREIQRERVREMRAARWQAADEAWFKAVEASDETATAAAVVYKQALRDAPAHASINDAQTPEALFAITLNTILGD